MVEHDRSEHGSARPSMDEYERVWMSMAKFCLTHYAMKGQKSPQMAHNRTVCPVMAMHDQ